MGKIISLFAGFLLRSVVVKGFVLFALYYLIQAIIPFLTSLLPTETNLPELFDLLPDDVWYYLNYFKIPFGISLVISAMLTRFIIRRIPIIG